MHVLDILHILTVLYFLCTFSLNFYMHKNITAKPIETQQLFKTTTTTTTTTTATTSSVEQKLYKHKNNNNDNKIKGLSGCILIKDENHNLIEWLAYHYTMLPLHYLVIAIDPNGISSSPINIINRWNKDITNTEMNITIWNDNDYLPKHLQ